MQGSRNIYKIIVDLNWTERAFASLEHVAEKKRNAAESIKRKAKNPTIQAFKLTLFGINSCIVVLNFVLFPVFHPDKPSPKESPISEVYPNFS